MSTLAFGHHEDRTPTHGYAATREAAMAAFARAESKSMTAVFITTAIVLLLITVAPTAQ
jgi:sulfur relay (sulfurtransferase) DsrF/TusC family protein